jgi:AcrR family transcriptional regulator
MYVLVHTVYGDGMASTEPPGDHRDGPGESGVDAAPGSLLQALDEGPARLGAGDVAAAQRRRMLAAMVATAAEKGYAATTVADVVARARVSRATFYDQFADKGDCFLAAFSACAQSLARTLRDGIGPESRLTPRARVHATFTAYLADLAAFPEGAHVCLVEVHAAGPLAAEARRAAQARFAAVLRDLHRALADDGEPVRPLTDFDFEALVGAVSSLVTTRVAAGAAADLPLLVEPLERFLLTYFGLDPPL